MPTIELTFSKMMPHGECAPDVMPGSAALAFVFVGSVVPKLDTSWKPASALESVA